MADNSLDHVWLQDSGAALVPAQALCASDGFAISVLAVWPRADLARRWQVGSQVSTVELGNNLQLNKKTVERYLDLLSKVFIIYPLSGYSRNLRKEVTKSKKWYFYDNGIRNALINNFSPIASRNDIGQLWEQYVIAERIKFNAYRKYQPEYFFWRTYDGQEIDFLEQQNQHLKAFECKWQPRSVKKPLAFGKAYPEADFIIVDQTNYLDWIAG